MSNITILTEAELRQLVPLDVAAVDCVAQAFAALGCGDVVMPPILSMAIAAYNGEVDVKTAYVAGLPSFAIKMSPGFFDNPKIGLPATSGLMILFSSHTGQLETLLLDNGYLTDIRTAAAGALAARLLTRKDAAKVTILGAGAQARLQLEALTLVRPIAHAKIWARDASKAQSFALEASQSLGLPATATTDAAGAVSWADIIVTATPARSPILRSEWLRAGQHVTAMGSDQHDKCELDPQCFSIADAYVPDRQSQTEVLGELRSAIEAGTVKPGQSFVELGQMVLDPSRARTSDTQITICDLTGTGVQDTAIATLAKKRADAAGAGISIDA